MYAAEFEYASPTSLESAISMLSRHGDDAKIIAGGQSLVPMMNLRLLQPAILIDISRLPVADVQLRRGVLTIPAGTRHRQLASDPLIREHAPILAESAQHIGNVRVRNRGTIGGSVAHADPAAELPCVLTALGASIGVQGPGGQRTIPAGDFFVTYLTTALEPGEIVTEVQVPALPSRSGQAFVEFARRANDFAVVEAAAAIELDRRQRCKRVSLVLGGVQDRPLDVSDTALEVLGGDEPSEAAFTDIGRRARAQASPQDDVHGTAAFRSQLVETLSRRALTAAADRARTGRS